MFSVVTNLALRPESTAAIDCQLGWGVFQRFIGNSVFMAAVLGLCAFLAVAAVRKRHKAPPVDLRSAGNTPT